MSATRSKAARDICTVSRSSGRFTVGVTAGDDLAPLAGLFGVLARLMGGASSGVLCCCRFVRVFVAGVAGVAGVVVLLVPLVGVDGITDEAVALFPPWICFLKI